MLETVLVTKSEFRKGKGLFLSEHEFGVEAAPMEEVALAEMVRVRQCRGVILGVQVYHAPLYEALGRNAGTKGAIIARFGVGHDGIDKTLARQHHIVVTNTPGALDRSVAEHALWLIGSLARKIPQQCRRMRDGEFTSMTGLELGGKTLAVIGFGRIGRQVAAAAHSGFGMKVIVVDCRSAHDLAAAAGMSVAQMKGTFGIAQCTHDLPSALQEADIVSIHIPGGAETQNLFDATILGHFKRGALLVNTARGAVIDECALYDAVAERRLGGAALDVFHTEPYQPCRPDKDLRTVDNIILTPHTASNTHEANERMARACFRNIRNFFAGRLDDLTRVDLPLK